MAATDPEFNLPLARLGVRAGIVLLALSSMVVAVAGVVDWLNVSHPSDAWHWWFWRLSLPFWPVTAWVADRYGKHQALQVYSRDHFVWTAALIMVRYVVSHVAMVIVYVLIEFYCDAPVEWLAFVNADVWFVTKVFCTIAAGAFSDSRVQRWWTLH